MRYHYIICHKNEEGDIKQQILSQKLINEWNDKIKILIEHASMPHLKPFISSDESSNHRWGYISGSMSSDYVRVVLAPIWWEFEL